MIYSPEPQAFVPPCAIDRQAILQSVEASCARGLGGVPGAAAIPDQRQKANRISMSRGFFLSLQNVQRMLPPIDPASCAMRTLPWVSLGILMLGVGGLKQAQGQSANTWDKRGADAEARQDYDTAYEDYKKAHEKKPNDMRYEEHFDRLRFLAGMQHVDRGRLLRQNGDWNGAMQQFLRAREIDPSNQTAEQEIMITQRDQPQPTPTGPAAAAALQELSQEHKVQQEIATIAGPIQLKPVSNDPITLHMVEDVKNIYQAIGKLAGLNVIFDPDYTSKRIPIDLTNVTLAEALRIVGTVSGTFYKPVTQNTIFVAQNSRTKRTDLDDLAVQTFYLQNSSQPNDGNEILTGLRLLLDPSVKLYLVPSQNAIVMRATADQLLLAQKLINDFDRARPEVVVDVAVLEVNRDRLRDLGITLPTSIGLTPQLPTTSTTSTSTTSSTTPSTSTTATLSLSNLVHLNSNDFAVNISGGTLNAMLTDTVLQNPRIRATDGQRATLKIGEKVPIATGSYNAGVSTGVASIGVQTQFTYLDVGVNIDITPTVHLDREVSLKTKIEVSQENGSVSEGSGVTEPIIAQRVLEQVIQLKEGEPSVLAGIVEKSNLKNVSGTPYLGELPFFKYFFSSQSKEVIKDEIVFLLIPHIVRESVLTQANLAAIDTGTSQSVELRRDDDPARIAAAGKIVINAPPGSAEPSNAADAAAAAIQQMSAPTQVPPTAFAGSAKLPTALPVPDSPNDGFAPPVSVALVPANGLQAVGSTFQVAVNVRDGKDLVSVPMQIQFNPNVLQLQNVDAGTYLSKDGKPATVVHRDDGNGMVTIGATRPPQATGVSGTGSVCLLTFKAVAQGDSTISFVKVGAKNSAQLAIAATPTNAVVHVK
jgi:general secretion pathway protein D